MADGVSMEAPSRRDFLFVATGAAGAVAAASAVWPLIDQMNPDASILAAASTEVDLNAIAEGQIVTVKWRGKPVFVRHRTAKEIAESCAVPLSELRDPATDQSRAPNPEWLVVIGICTHLGCCRSATKAPSMAGSARATVRSMISPPASARGRLPTTSFCLLTSSSPAPRSR